MKGDKCLVNAEVVAAAAITTLPTLKVNRKQTLANELTKAMTLKFFFFSFLFVMNGL